MSGSSLSVLDPLVLTESDWETVPCNFCGGTSTRLLFRIKVFQIVECAACGLVFTNPRLTRARLKAVYDESYFQSPDSLVHGYDDYAAERPSIEKTFRERWENALRFSPVKNGRVLDIGCALGFLLNVARESGWQPQGLDMSDYAVAYARDVLKLPAEVSDLTSLPFEDNSFDAIVNWDVIEHIPDPSALLKEMRRVLRPGAVLSMITPDRSSITARIFGSRWVEYQKPHEHLYFFARKSFCRKLSDLGFRVRWVGTAGKYVPLGFALERLKAYNGPVFGAALSASKALGLSSRFFRINPLDKMSIVAQAVK